jgi:hypothetical protein
MNSPGSGRTSRTGIKLIALLLILGGGAGLTIALWADAISTSTVHIGFIASAVVLFAWSIWAGIDLWKGTRRGYIASKVLFALQIPFVTFPGFAYQFYIGSILSLSFNNTPPAKLGFDFQLGSAINFQLSSEIENFVLGVNLIAVVALIYLMRLSRQSTGPDPLQS